MSIPNFLILESIKKFDGIHAQLLKKPILWQDGYIIPSTDAGLGVELNEELCEELAYDEIPTACIWKRWKPPRKSKIKK